MENPNLNSILSWDLHEILTLTNRLRELVKFTKAKFHWRFQTGPTKIERPLTLCLVGVEVPLCIGFSSAAPRVICRGLWNMMTFSKII